MKRIREEEDYALQPAENHVHQGVIFCIQNVLKFTYSNLEFPNFPGEAEDPWTHFFSGEGQGVRGRKGRGPSSNSHNGFLDVSRSNGGLKISGQLSCLTIFFTSLSVAAFLRMAGFSMLESTGSHGSKVNNDDNN